MLPQRDLNAGMRCVKYMLFLFNLVFALTGALIIMVGISIKAIYHDYIVFLDSRYLPPTTLLVVTGFIIFIVAFFGCCGAARESTLMIMIFSLMLAVIFILEFSAGIAGYMLHDGLSEMLATNLNNTMNDYPYDNHTRQTVDFLQRELVCCGIWNPRDWEQIPLSPENTIAGEHLPLSCCADFNMNSTCDGYFSVGCLQHLEGLVGQSALLLATAALSIALLQLLGVIFGCSLAKSIRVHKTERLRRRQELQEQLINSYAYVGASDPKRAFPVMYYLDHEFKGSNA